MRNARETRRQRGQRAQIDGSTRKFEFLGEEFVTYRDAASPSLGPFVVICTEGKGKLNLRCVVLGFFMISVEDTSFGLAMPGWTQVGQDPFVNRDGMEAASLHGRASPADYQSDVPHALRLGSITPA